MLMTHPDERYGSRTIVETGADPLPGSPVRSTVSPESGAIGSSAVFQRLLQLVDLVAPTQGTVLISGPTGAGKEIIAQLVHSRSAHPEAPFVDVNCGALPEHLIEAELFGYARGAFTGAVTSRAGFFALAGRGSLFLDEIGELPMLLQSKLLRVLETRRYRPLGASSAHQFDGRIIAATHCDLAAMVKAGRFREDLYYRLAVLTLDVPGLDQRRDDIPELAAYFAARQPRSIRFTPAAIDRLCRHPWPGHVRELRNMIERLSIMSESSLIDTASLDSFLPAARPAGTDHVALAEALMALDGEDKLAAAEQLLIAYAMRLSDGNKTIAARRLGINRKAIERRIHAGKDRGQLAQQLLDEGRALIEGACFRDAIGVLSRGLDQLTVVHHDAHRRLRCDLYQLLAVAHRGVNGWQSADAVRCYQQALAEASALNDEKETTALLFGIWSTQLMALDLVVARATAQDMLQRAQATGESDLLAHAHLAMANTLFWLGDHQEALACLRRGRLSGETKQAGAGSQGIDLAGLALTFEGLSCFQIGAFPRARAAQGQLVRRGAADNPHPFHRAIALQGAAWLACLFEDMEQLAPLARELEALACEHGYAFYRGIGQIFRACTLAAEGQHAQAEQLMADGYQRHMLCEGGLLFHSFQAWKRAEALLLAGQLQACLQLLEDAIELALAHQERAYLIELYEVRAQAWSALGDQSSAERELRSALSTAQALGAVAGNLAVSTRLAALLEQCGRRTEAHELLTRALRSVECEMVFPRLSRAQQLLARLG
jgi:DNA-binding NtrC family response regulator